MSMNESTFKDYMAQAQVAQRINPRFWEGYMRGLRRLYHGERFGTAAEHEQWMTCASGLITASYPNRELGYRAGYAGKRPGELNDP